MPITEKQREQRRKHIGSTDMAAILGVSPYATAYDIWAYKTGKAEEPDLSDNQCVIAGTNFEDGVLTWAAEALDTKLKRNQYRAFPDLYLGANIDAITEKAEPVEAKTVGMMHFAPAADWGPDGSDEVPDQYIVQCHTHMLCTGADLCHLAAFIAGRGFAMFRIERNEGLADVMAAQAMHFWEAHVMADKPPEDVAPTLAVAKLIRRVPQSIAKVDDKIVQTWRMAKSHLSDARKQAEAAEAALLGAMGDAEAASTEQSGGVTYYEIQRKGYTVEPSTYRRLTYKPKGLLLT